MDISLIRTFGSASLVGLQLLQLHGVFSVKFDGLAASLSEYVMFEQTHAAKAYHLNLIYKTLYTMYKTDRTLRLCMQITELTDP